MNALFVAWRPADGAGWRPVGRLSHDDGLYRFCYTRGAQGPDFRPFPQMERLDQIYESNDLFPLFANRLLPPSRPEYRQYLTWSDLDPNQPPDPIVVLSVTEGIRQTDAIEVFPCPAPDAEGCYLSKFFLHGVRWMSQAAIDRIAKLQPSEPLKIMFDFQNEYDPQAVAVRTDLDRALIGYVPRYFARDVWELGNTCDPSVVELSVLRVNPNAPLQNRVLCRMRGCWPVGFQPCSGEEFQPIPAGVPATCHP